MFAYCNNNPIYATDWTGDRPVWEYIVGNGCVGCTDTGTGSYSIAEDGEYITDQEHFSASSWPLGLSTVSNSGCGIVAAYNILTSRGIDVSFSDVFFSAFKHDALVDCGMSGTDVSKMIDVIIDLDPSISISNSADPIESSFVVYGFYEDGHRVGGHAAAAIHYSDRFYIIINGIGVTSDYAVDLFSYFSAINRNESIKIDGHVAFH